ncbi:MAG TPA: D-alanyl-D-alanine carboxypeptidase family protein [Xanthomonadales bacterium]|nr:D-alanyl-D-alanine carboxypeptidase family protein [Xanthomonadales bacterium]
MNKLHLFAFLLLSGTLAAQTPLPQPSVPKPAPAPVVIPDPPTLPVKSAILIEQATGQVIAEQAADERVEPASITKVMAAYVLFVELRAGRLKLDDQVRISENAWKGGLGGSRMFVVANSSVAAKDLLLGMIVQSGNDATIALAEHLAGSEDAFVQQMNTYAQRIGMKNSHFTNAPGLPDPEHYSTARDIALLSRTMIAEFPEYYEWYSTPEFTFNGIRQYNRNALLRRDESVDGIKTGHTESAGFCLASSALRGEMRLIAVVMGSKSEETRAQESQSLLNYGFRFYETHKLYTKGQTLAEPKVWKGEVEKVALGVADDVLVVIPRGKYESLQARMNLPSLLVAPVEAGQAVGSVRVELDDKLLIERPLVAISGAPEGGIWRRMVDGFWLWFEDDEAAE